MISAPIQLDEDGRHPNGCNCLLDQSRRWLHFTPEEEKYEAGWGNAKTASFGGLRTGSGEPSANYDKAVANADMVRALALVPTIRLQAVAHVWMTEPHPAREHRNWKRRPGDEKGCICTRYARWTGDCEGVIADPDGPQGRMEAVMGKLGMDANAVFESLDECAVEMSVILGERLEGRPSRAKRTRPLIVVEEPPEWELAPANFR